MTKFLLNMGYQWGDGALDYVDGYVFNAAAIHGEQAKRRPFEIYEDQWVLFDPQLYLAALDSRSCEQTCARLATYPWFRVTVPEYDSSVMTQRDWFESVKQDINWQPSLPTDLVEIRDVIKKCFMFQEQFGCTHLIIPTPSVDNSEDQFGVQLQWLEAASSLRDQYKLPMLATVAINDYLLEPYVPSKNTLLQTALDNLTVSAFEGLYVLVVQEGAESPRLLDNHVVESLLYISHLVGGQAKKTVVVNFSDDLGYACLAAGATTFVGGASIKQRRMCLADFVQRGGGPAYPRFYSHQLIGDYLTQSDLSKIRDIRLLRLIDRDVTADSRPLLEALKKGGDANAVPSWRQSMNNVTAAQRHRVTLMHQAVTQLAKIPEEDRLTAALTWVQNAEANTALMDSRLQGNPLSENGRHLPVWSRSIESLMDYIGAEETETI